MNMNFTVNKETRTVSISKTFPAALALVWDAYTKPEGVERWAT